MRIFIILNSIGLQQHHGIFYFIKIVYRADPKRLEQVGKMTTFFLSIFTQKGKPEAFISPQ